MAFSGALSLWPALARAEPTPTQTPAPESPKPENGELIAAAPKGQAATDFGAGDSQVERARALFWSAHERYDVGDYAAAAKLFEESYAVFPQAEVLFNIALARARSGRCSDAEHAFAEYSKAVAPSEATRAASESFQGTLSGCSEASNQEPMPLQLPGPVDPAPAPAPEPAPVVLTPTAAVVADAPAPNYWTTERVVGWSLLGAAAAATGVAFYFDNQLRDARQAHKEILSDPNPDTNAGDESAELEKQYTQAQIGIVAATATALGCAAVGAGLLIYGGADGAASTTAHFAVGTSGARVAVSGRF
jgi:hypothetical protein